MQLLINDQSHNLISSLKNSVNPQVPGDSLYLIVLKVPIASEELQSCINGLITLLSGRHLSHAREKNLLRQIIIESLGCQEN